MTVNLATGTTSHRQRHADRPLAWLYPKRWLLLVATAAVVWTAVVARVAHSLYLDFAFQRFDLGNMVQAVWSTSQGRLLETTHEDGLQGSRLGSHVDPLLAGLTPLWAAFPSPMSLVTAQIVACALGAIPLYWLGRRHLAEPVAAMLAVAYLAYPWLAWTALDPIHPATLAIPLLFFAIVFLDSDRLVLFSIVAVPLALAGELFGLALAGLGCWYWLARGRPRAGLVIASAGVAWTAICLELIVPHYSGGDSQYYALYAAVGESPLGVVQTALTDPVTVLREISTTGDIAYLVALAAPLAGTFVLSPLILVAALPQLTANLLSSSGGHIDPRLHTVSVLIPPLWAATVFGLARLPARLSMLLGSLVLALSVGALVVLGPQTGSSPSAAAVWYYGPPPPIHLDALRQAVALVPADAPVAATAKAGSQLSARRHFYSVPILGDADWVVVDTLDPWVPLPPEDSEVGTIGSFRPDLVRAMVARLAASDEWARAFDQQGVAVFRRRE